MPRIALPFNAALLGALLCALVFFVDSGEGFVGPRPSAPYRDVTKNNELANHLKNHTQPTQTSQTGGLVRKGLNDVQRGINRMPKYRMLGTISVTAVGFEVGWKIGRGIDTRWLHLGGDVGTWTGAPLIGSNHMQWTFRTSADHGRPPNIWNLEQTSPYMPDTGRMFAIDPSSCVAPDAYCYGWGGAYGSTAQKKQVNQEFFDFITRDDLPGTLAIWGYSFNGVRCGGSATWYGDQLICYARYVPESEMDALIEVYRSEPFTGQPFDRITNITVPADLTAADLEAARLRLDRLTADADAAQKWLNYLLAPSDPGYPNPIETEIDFPPAEEFETYDTYLARLRANGWLGEATVIQLDEDDADHRFGAGGVPCTSVMPYTVVTPNLPVTFYRNPTPLGSGPGDDSTTWDCRAGSSSPDGGGCEYDEYVVLYPPWEAGFRYLSDAYERACADAWADFENRGGVYGLPSETEPQTGKLKNESVIEGLTSDGSSILDWRKHEWGPFVVNGMTYVVHAYRHVNGTVREDHNLDFKIKFRTEIPYDYPGG